MSDNSIILTIKETILKELQSQVQTTEEIENIHLPYDDDHSYAYGQKAGLEEAIEIINNIFDDFGF